jgi:hypothetical protein
MKSSKYALCHCNNIQIDVLMEDMLEGIFRNLSASSVGGGDAIATNDVRQGFTARLMGTIAGEKKPQIYSSWLRLPSWRALPASITCSTYRITTHPASSQVGGGGIVVVPAAVTRDGVGALSNALASVGFGRIFGERSADADDTRTLIAKWNAIQSAQVPQYLFFCLQKSSKMLTLSDDSVAKRISEWDYTAGNPNQDRGKDAGLKQYMYARNQDANASIVDFSLQIQSAVGSFTMSSQKYPYIRKKLDLWKFHLKNCVDGYCDSSVEKWAKNTSCLLLHASDFLRGLTTTSCSFPVQFDAECKFMCRREFIDGNAASALGSISPAVLRDVVQGDPTMCMVFTGGSMTIAPSSAVTAQANLSHASALDILSRQ